jgi:hypothetical protein
VLINEIDVKEDYDLTEDNVVNGVSLCVKYFNLRSTKMFLASPCSTGLGDESGIWRGAELSNVRSLYVVEQSERRKTGRSSNKGRNARSTKLFKSLVGRFPTP